MIKYEMRASKMNSHEILISDPNPKLQWVNLLLTYKCTAECSHCFTSSSTCKDDPMNLIEVQEYLEEAKKVGASRVWIFGGEPFFYFELLLGATKLAKQFGFHILVTSNAFWAITEESALRRLGLLKEAGLDSIAFSADPFHWEYVPLEYVRNAAKAAEKLGILDGIWNVVIEEEPAQRLNREIIARMSTYKIDAGTVTFIGTAAEVLAERVKKQPWIEYDECNIGKEAWIDYNKCKIGRGFQYLGSVDIDPYGYVQRCSGISIGNAKESKLSEIIRIYDIEDHPIMKVLNEQGPVGLAKLAMKYGFRPTEYADGCHLCYEARKVLLKHYPQYLAPTIWYERTK